MSEEEKTKQRKQRGREQVKEQIRAYLKFQKSLVELAKTPELKENYEEIVELIKEAFRGEETCERCGGTYENYLLPGKWWKKLPKEEQGKCLCFSCYMELIKQGEEPNCK